MFGFFALRHLPASYVLFAAVTLPVITNTMMFAVVVVLTVSWGRVGVPVRPKARACHRLAGGRVLVTEGRRTAANHAAQRERG